MSTEVDLDKIVQGSWKEYINKFITANRQIISRDTKRQLTMTLKRAGLPKGSYKGPLTAPDMIFSSALEELLNIAEINGVINGICLSGWGDINKALIDDVATWLGDKVATLDDLESLSGDYVTLKPDTNSVDVKLALVIILTDPKKEVTNDNPEVVIDIKPKQVYSMLLQEFIIKLQEVPVDDETWKQIDEFVKELTRIRSDKSVLRVKEDIIKRVTDARKGLRHYEQLGTKLGLNLDPLLTVDITSDNSNAILDEITEMEQLLSQYDTIVNRLPANISERREKLSQEKTLLDQIEERYQNLSITINKMSSDISGQQRAVHVTGVDIGVINPVNTNADKDKTEIAAVVDEDILVPHTPEKRTISGLATPEETEQEDTVKESVPEITGENEDNLIWKLIERHDLEGAYWCAVALEKEGTTVPDMPSWLPAALCCSKWLSHGANIVEGDLLSIINSKNVNTLSDHGKALGVACSLMPSLTNPATGAKNWLVELSHEFAFLNRITILIQDFTNTQFALTAEDINAVRTGMNLDNLIIERRNKLNGWVKRVKQHDFGFHLANSLLKFMVTDATSPMLKLLDPACKNDCSAAKSIMSDLDKWRNRNSLSEIIRDIERSKALPGRNAVQGFRFQQIVNFVEEGVQLIGSWGEACQHRQIKLEQEKWWYDRVIKFIDEMSRLINDIKDELPSSNTMLSVKRAAVYSVIHTVLSDLEILIDGKKAGNLPPYVCNGLIGGLSFRLLWTPVTEMGQDENGYPYPSQSMLANLPDIISTHPIGPELLPTVIEKWMILEDFRWVDTLIQYCNSEEIKSKLEDNRAKRQKDLGSILKQKVEAVDSLLSQAKLEYSIDSNKAAEFGSKLELYESNLMMQDAETKVPNSIATGPFYANIRSKLDEIEKDIRNQRDVVINDRKQKWADLAPVVENLPSQLKAKDVSSLVDKLITSMDIYQLDEILSTLEIYRDSKSKEGANRLEAIQNSIDDNSKRIGLTEFKNEAPQLKELLETKGGITGIYERFEFTKKGEKPPEFLQNILKIKRLQSARLRDFTEALGAWKNLKSRADSDKSDYSHSIYTILKYLEFQLEPFELGKSGVRVKENRGWALWQYSMQSVSRTAVPQFGSERNGKYSVLCTWDRPRESKLESILIQAGIGKEPVIVIFLGTLAPNYYDAMANFAYDKGSQAVILDELMLLFLARETDIRFHLFLRCALPATDINPYVPFAAGNVPKEMFYGRDTLIERLQKPLETALVYGGRQLGKSSLLKQVRDGFNNSDISHYAFYEDIKTIVSPFGDETYPDKLWIRLSHTLKENRLISEQVSDSPDNIQRGIRRLFRDNPELRILMLFDEADNFLAADALNEFKVTSEIKRLMDDTDRHFKAIFAGLHNVFRFSSVGNQPLAHMGAPIVIGPLEPPAAVKLIKKPLEAIGYGFIDDSIIWHILSLTNYHPGLIQYFCYMLVKDLRKHKKPPYNISNSDIDRIYRNSEIRMAIRERFIWTVDLDPHYGILVRGMILDQLEQRDGFSKAYSINDLHIIGEDWWPAGFSSIGTNEIQDYVLELKELGVLAETSDDKYRLRSPNVVRLLGTDDEIWRKLDEIAAKNESPADFGLLHYHVDMPKPFDKSKGFSFNPFSQSQMKRLAMGVTGVTIIMGSNATGINNVSVSIESLLKNNFQNAYPLVHLRQVSDKSIKSTIIETMQAHANNSGVLISCELMGTATELQEAVTAVKIYLESGLSGCRIWQHFLLIYNPQVIEEWATIERYKRDELEYKTNRIGLEAWHNKAIEHVLTDYNLAAIESTITSVMDCTGGFYFLLDKLFKGMKGDPKDFTSKFKTDLRSPGSVLWKEFIDSLGFSTESQSIYKRLCANLKPGIWEDFGLVNLIFEDMPQSTIEKNLYVLNNLSIIDIQSDKIRLNPFLM